MPSVALLVPRTACAPSGQPPTANPRAFGRPPARSAEPRLRHAERFWYVGAPDTQRAPVRRTACRRRPGHTNRARVARPAPVRQTGARPAPSAWGAKL